MNVEETLLRAKASRLVSYLFYSSDFSRLISRDQMMEEDLKVAITNHEFMMYYQPQYNTAINKIVGLEALIRWNNPKYISENVEHFIKLAEKNGMIVEIGEFIIDETFKFAKKIEDKNIHISMNVSPVQLLQSGFVSELIEKFDFYKLKPGSISLEITETFLMENTELVLDKLKLLQGKGFHIHLDDFGVGYSSMLYLKNLPVNAIKIDKEFIKYLLIDRFSKVIVSKIAQIATQLDLEIIAEGVEDVNQALYLSKNNCDIIQGFLISQAVSEEKTLELISKCPSPPSARRCRLV